MARQLAIGIFSVDVPARRRYRGRVAINFAVAAIGAKLASRKPVYFEGTQESRWAAVAIVLRPGSTETEALFIRRSDRPGDPWSGHMAFPGGHAEGEDGDLLTTAQRETGEEVGLHLEEHEYLGRLDDVPATIRGRFAGMVVAPHVFCLRSEPSFSLNFEVAEVFWAPLRPMAEGELDTTKTSTHRGEPMDFPGYRVGEQVVWGLTHRMLREFFAALR